MVGEIFPRNKVQIIYHRKTRESPCLLTSKLILEYWRILPFSLLVRWIYPAETLEAKTKATLLYCYIRPCHISTAPWR
ncbi:hypothetical protein X798_01353 [Onchocerca flexuosa]|uniref:Uncharacterized protein n=1 Tax=Onchocerca flexuosa TaxID=387005 RepID=A0A238C2Y1_9BILA|nr:hypothetical protein X798_01353 [Onchocerca flexuosa]